KHGHDQLTYIVHDTTCDADSQNTEASALFQKSHHSQAEQSAGKTVQNTEHAAKNKAGQDNSCYRQKISLSEAHLVKCDHYDQIGKSKFNSRNTDLEWYKGFHITENQGQCREN